jgi:predicted helicase
VIKSMDFNKYLNRINTDLAQGNSTEHTHRPALQTLIESVADIRVTNEPRRIACGAPDYIVTRLTPTGSVPLGYIEAKDVGKNLDDIENDEQLNRYRSSLRNLILTDYLEFRLYRNGEWIQTARLAKQQKNGTLKVDPSGHEHVARLLNWFIASDVSVITTPRDLAQRMAQMARMLRDLICNAFASEAHGLTLGEVNTRSELQAQFDGFRKVLLGEDLTSVQFADMYAQTICYGLFAARCNHSSGRFTRQGAAYELPKTNPFLRKLFQSIAGADLDERIAWAVDDLADLLTKADMTAVLADFGRARSGQMGLEDPVVHFYETFLAAYDPALRESRGVYYTPEPVVSYIVRSVDHILKADFKLLDGLADNSKVVVKRRNGRIGSRGEALTDNVATHRVQILDPAVGTGTFLFSVIAQIRESFKGNAGLWPSYVAEHLLPRLYGFELLMAPYAVAHMKLGLQLKDSGYDFASDERLRVYLTNTLEKANELAGLPLFTQWLADEAAQAGEIKQGSPIMVVLGNPPYSGHSANTGEWIANLLRGVDTLTNRKTHNYFECDGQPLGERNPKWLNDDYVKFIRFSQWRIEQTGYGILAFVTNHGFLDNPTFRGMRQSLMDTFDDIYLLDMHGNSKRKEKTPEGGRDDNVFDIQQGVSIGIFVKRAKNDNVQNDVKHRCNVRHAHLYGMRESKYAWLWDHEISNTKWKKVTPKSPDYMFIPQDAKLLKEYQIAYKLTDIMPVNVLGFQTHRDDFAIDMDSANIERRILDMRSTNITDAEFAGRYSVIDNRDWQLKNARTMARQDSKWREKIIRISYRAFDFRWGYFNEVAMDYPRKELKEHVAGRNNWVLNLPRIVKTEWQHALVTDCPSTAITMDINGSYAIPLYLYEPVTTQIFDHNITSSVNLNTKRLPNFTQQFVNEISLKITLKFKQDGLGDLKKTWGPEDFFHYAYAVLYAPSYRLRYADFLKRDFPRLPITSDLKQFIKLCELGAKLVDLHVMADHAEIYTKYPIAGNNRIDKVTFDLNRVWINSEQYFEGVSESTWNYRVGGYQVAQKWLKDRKGRLLTFDDLQHYQFVVAAISETISLQVKIDAAIPTWPIV